MTQVGGGPPVAVALLDNHDVLVADDSRVQRFDHRTGRSEALIDSLLKPAGLAVCNDGLLAVSDRLSRTVRFLHDDGRPAALHWPERMFAMPTALAVARSTGHIAVLDAERATVSVHLPPATGRSQSSSSAASASAAAVCTMQLASPTHVAVDVNSGGKVFVSDALHYCVKVCLFTLAHLSPCVLSMTALLYSRRDLLPGRMSYKATKPDCLSCLSF